MIKIDELERIKNEQRRRITTTKTNPFLRSGWSNGANDVKKDATGGRNEKAIHLIIKRSLVIYISFVQELARYIQFEYFLSVCGSPIHFLNGDS